MGIANLHLLKNEIEIMQELNHPNIVKFIDVYYTHKHCYIITEYCEGGNLEKYIKQHEELEWGTILHHLLQGCHYLEKNQIVHRDLKPANIFLKEGVWKIGDFGFARKIPYPDALIIENYKVGSPLFMPP